MSFLESVALLVGQATRTGIYRSDYGGLKGAIDPKAYVGKTGAGTYVCVRADEVRIASEPAMLLEQLHASASASERQVFPEILTPRLTRENARVVARTLAATGHLHALIAVSSTDAIEEEFWRGLIHTLRFEPHLFSEPDLKTVERAAEHGRDNQRRRAVLEAQRQEKERDAFPIPSPSSVVSPGRTYSIPPLLLDPVIDELKSVVARVRYLRVAKAIRENQSPTVEVDRQLLLSRLQTLGFSAALATTSDDIERRAAIAGTETDFKTVMDLVRAFLEEFVEEACRRIETRVGTAAPLPDKANHFQPYRLYLETAGILVRDESSLLQSLYKFMSNEGVHKLGSAPEQAQVARVTVIEWCMLVAGRVQAFLGCHVSQAISTAMSTSCERLTNVSLGQRPRLDCA